MFKRKKDTGSEVQVAKTQKTESDIDYSLDWENTNVKINVSKPTVSELSDAMNSLRTTLKNCDKILPYTYVSCRREVAQALRRKFIEMGYEDTNILCTPDGPDEKYCFSHELNQYVYVFGVANHPMAFQDMYDEVCDY